MQQREPYFTHLNEGPRKRLRGDRGESIRLVDQDLGPAQNVDVHLNTLEPGSGEGPLHYHERAENVYIVLAGEIEVRIGDSEYRLGPDDVLWIPPGLIHATSNPGSVPARFLEVYAPAGSDFHIVTDAAQAGA